MGQPTPQSLAVQQSGGTAASSLASLNLQTQGRIVCVRSIKSSWGEGWYPCVLEEVGMREASAIFSTFCRGSATARGSEGRFDPGPLSSLFSLGPLRPTWPLPSQAGHRGGLVTGLLGPRSRAAGHPSPMALRTPKLQEGTSSGDTWKFTPTGRCPQGLEV